MENAGILLAVALILAVAVVYVIVSKKKGRKCIGCPDSCSGGCPGCGGK